ncbi:protocadherin-15-like [Antedon mediterranea]|uniref:protocadherin-15-like n=1 Tax=Antedon mediterranea TaxID=105859 RepID=UPI003AF90014
MYNQALDILPGPIRAADGDLEVTDPGPIIYSILSGNPPGYENYISINSSTGNVSLLQPVSYETYQYFGLKLQAAQGDFSTIALLNVSVVDMNEFAPTLLHTSLVGYIDENSVDGTVVVSNEQGTAELEIYAEDKDVPENEVAGLVYVTNDTSGVFEIFPSLDTLSAKIVVQGPIDRELQHIYLFSLYVMENNTVDLNSSDAILVTIYVIDVNDEAPAFIANAYSNGLNGYKVSVRENVQPGFAFFQVMAADPDLAENGKFDFSIQSITNSGYAMFAVEQQDNTAILKFVSGILVARDTYVISLAATDRGITNTQTSVTSIEVDILPTNDTNAPEFLMRQYTASVTEEASFGTLVTTLTAMDEDGDTVSYQITNGNTNDAFIIKSLSGEVNVNSDLDREMLDSYVLTIKASDGTLMDTVYLYITILDSNDNNPIFNTSHLTFMVDEGVASGEVVGKVMAYDLDEPNSPNSEIEYSLMSNSFNIDPVSGVITTNKVLDREDQPDYTMSVTAQDKATNPRSTTIMVFVIVLDVNDNGPMFEQDMYSVTVVENSAIASILTVKASDPDLNAEVQYMITSGDTGMFSVGSESGDLFTLQPLDYEEQQLFTLQISATDINQGDSNLVGIATVQVQVQNINDNNPLFQANEYKGSVPEYADLGTVVVDSILATDADLGEFGQVTYKLHPESALFIFNENKILTKTGLTRATQDNITLTIIAEDMGVPPLNGTASIFIEITNRGVEFYEQPTFLQPEYSANVTENSVVNTTVTTVQALANEGEVVIYEIVNGNENGYFWINSVNNIGTIMTKTVIDRESTAEFSLTIQAMVVTNVPIEMNRKRKRKRRAEDPSVTIIVVEVGDINDNPPIFEQSLYVIGVSEGASSGTAIVTVKAVDPDADNNIVRYSLQPYSSGSENGFKPFMINDGSGRITTLEKFTSNSFETYKFTVLATVNTQEFSEATADVFVAKINDNHRTILVLSTSYDDALQHEINNEIQLENVLNAEVEIFDIRPSSDPINTDNHFYAINRDTGVPLTSDEIQKLIDQNTDVLADTIRPEDAFLTVMQPEQLVQNDDPWQLEYILIIIFACLLFIFTFLAIVVVYVSWKKRQMEREKQARMYVPMYTNLTAINDPNATEMDLIRISELSSDVHLRRSNPVYYDDQSVQASEQLFPNGAPTFLNARQNQIQRSQAEVYDNPACTMENGDVHSPQREETESEQADLVGSGPSSYTSEERATASPSHQYKSISEMQDFTDAATLERKEMLLYDPPHRDGYSSSPEGHNAPAVPLTSPPMSTPVSLQGVYVTPAKDVKQYNPPTMSSFQPIDQESPPSKMDTDNSPLPFDLPPPPEYPPPPENYREDDESSYGRPSLSSCTESEEKQQNSLYNSQVNMMPPPVPFASQDPVATPFGSWNPANNLKLRHIERRDPDRTTIIATYKVNHNVSEKTNEKHDTTSISDSGVNSEHGSPTSHSPQEGSFSSDEVESVEPKEQWGENLDNVQITAL